MMQRRKLGRTGLEVSEIAFGGVEIGMPYGIGIKGKSDMLSEREAVKLLHRATESGINFFDTARSYGRSEDIMGKAFKGMRDKVVISTKCVHLLDERGRLPDSNKLRKIMIHSLHESMKALQSDYVDIFMLHDAGMKIWENEDIVHVFSHLKQSGLIRGTGVSTYLPEETKGALDMGTWDVIQVPFNLMNQSHQIFFAEASKKRTAIIVRSVLLKGLLSEKGKNLHPALKEVEQHIAGYRELLNSHIPDISTLATKFALSFDEVSSVLVGIDKVAYLNKSLEVADGHYLDKKQLKHAHELAYPDPAFLNLHEWHQKGWLT